MKSLTEDLEAKGAKIGIRRPPGDNGKPEEVDLAKKAAFKTGVDESDRETLKIVFALAILALFVFTIAGLAVRLFFLASGGGPVPWAR